MGQTFEKNAARFFTQGFFQQLIGVDRSRWPEMEFVAGKLPARAADWRNGYGQRRIEDKNFRSVADFQFFRGRALAPVGEFVEHPGAVLVDQVFDIANPRLLG